MKQIYRQHDQIFISSFQEPFNDGLSFVTNKGSIYQTFKLVQFIIQDGKIIKATHLTPQK